MSRQAEVSEEVVRLLRNSQQPLMVYQKQQLSLWSVTCVDSDDGTDKTLHLYVYLKCYATVALSPLYVCMQYAQASKPIWNYCKHR